MSRFYSEALGKQDRSAFISGDEKIDAYFRMSVSQDVKRKYAACYVLIEKAGEKLAGFYTLSSSNIPLTDLPPDLARKMPRYPTVPAVLIGWLGRDLGFRNQLVGPMLLQDAIYRVAASPVGAYALTTDAIDQAAADFYKSYQFTPLINRPLSLFLPIATALQLPGLST